VVTSTQVALSGRNSCGYTSCHGTDQATGDRNQIPRSALGAPLHLAGHVPTAYGSEGRTDMSNKTIAWVTIWIMIVSAAIVAAGYGF